MIQTFKNGQGSVILRAKLLDSSSTTGAGLTGLDNSSSGLIISTIADNEATATAYAVASSKVETIATLGTFAAPTATKCRFKEVDSTNHKGVYEFQFDDARFAVSNAKSLLVSVLGATNLQQADFLVQLQSDDPYVAKPTNYASLSIDANGRVDVIKVAGTTQTAGDIIADTNDIQSRLPAALVSGRMDASVGAMAANTLTASALAADAVSEIQSGLSTLDAAGVRSAVGLASANLDTQLDALPTAAENASQVRTELTTELGRIDAAVSTRLASAGYTTPPTANAIADQVWDEAIADHAGAGSTGAALSAATAPSAAAVADAVWDEALADHSTAGTTGKGLTDAQSAGNPWSTTGLSNEGDYPAGSAGYLLAHAGDSNNGSNGGNENYQAGDTAILLFTINTAAGGAVAPDALPTAALWKNGVVDNTVTCTVANTGTTGEYKVTFTIPTGYALSSSIALVVTYVVSSVTYREPILNTILGNGPSIVNNLDPVVVVFALNTIAGGAVNGDSTPTAKLMRNGTVDSDVTCTVSSLAVTGLYKCVLTVPAGYASGDDLSVVVTYVVSAVTYRQEIDNWLVGDGVVGAIPAAPSDETMCRVYLYSESLRNTLTAGDTITFDLVVPGGGAAKSNKVILQERVTGTIDATGTMADEDGNLYVELQRTDTLTPTGCYYRVNSTALRIKNYELELEAATYDLSDIIV